MADMNRFLAKQVKQNTEEIANIKTGAVARYVEGTTTATGYSITLEEASPFVDGLLLLMKVPSDSIPNACLNYAGVGDRELRINNELLKQGTLKVNSVCFIRYNVAKDYWEVISGGSLTNVVVNGNGINYADTAGTGTVYDVTIANAPATPYIGFSLMLRAHEDSNDSQKINYNGSGAVAITTSGDPVKTGTIKKKSVFIVTYVGTSWELISGSGETLQYIFQDDATLGMPKYNVVSGIVDGQTTFGIIGGEITAYDPNIEVIRFLINGVEQIPVLDYTLDSVAQTITMVGKTLLESDTQVLIKYRNISMIPKGTIIHPTLAVNSWVKVGDHYETTVSARNVNESTNVLFSVHDDAGPNGTYEFVRCKVRASMVSEDKIIISALSKPIFDVRCSIMLVRNNSTIPKETALYPIITSAEWQSVEGFYQTTVSADYILYGANIIFTVHEDCNESQISEYAATKMKAVDIDENKIIIRAIRKPGLDIQCSILITR